MRRFWITLIIAIIVNRAAGAAPEEQVISFECGLAIDAVFAEIDRQSNNPVTQEAVASINEKNGQFVCFQTAPNSIYVRLQSKDMKAGDNKLLFLVNTNTYRVSKTFYGP